MKSLLFIIIFSPLFSNAQKINSTETKNKHNIYNDAIKQYLLHNRIGQNKSDTIFIEKKENYGDSIMTIIDGTVIQILDWPEIKKKLDLVESFTLHGFFSLKFEQSQFYISVIPFHTTKNSDGVNLGNGGGCRIVYTFDNSSKQFRFKKVSCWGL